MRTYTKKNVSRRIKVWVIIFSIGLVIGMERLFITANNHIVLGQTSFPPFFRVIALVVVFSAWAYCTLRYAGSFKSLKRVCFLSEKNIVDFYMTDDLYALDADLRKVSHMFINPEKHRIERSIMFPSRGEIVRCVITLEVLPDVASLQKYVDAHYGGTESVNRTAVRDILTRALKDVALDPAILVSIKRRIRLDLANYGLVATRCDCVSSNHRWFLG